jgi:hypothetical protein
MTHHYVCHNDAAVIVRQRLATRGFRGAFVGHCASLSGNDCGYIGGTACYFSKVASPAQNNCSVLSVTLCTPITGVPVMNQIATLDERETKTLTAIVAILRSRRLPPSMREIAAAAELSVTRAHQVVHQLDAKGYVRLLPGVARGIDVLMDAERRPVSVGWDGCPAEVSHA